VFLEARGKEGGGAADEVFMDSEAAGKRGEGEADYLCAGAAEALVDGLKVEREERRETDMMGPSLRVAPRDLEIVIMDIVGLVG
jgi:hypothetical protein